MYKRLNVVRKSKISRTSIIPRIFKWRKIRQKKLLKSLTVFSILEKRERFAFQTILLTAGVLGIQLIWQDVRFYMVILLAGLSYVLTFWSLKEDIKGNEKILLFILPVFFTASLSFFYFLLPPRWIIRLITTGIFAVGTYAILLVENIYNVASQRSIQLLRAAQSVGLLITLSVVFLSANIIYSLRIHFLLNFLLLFTVGFCLSLQSLWSINLERTFNRKLLLFSLIVGLGIGELSMALSFWPIVNASFSLLLTATFYAMVSIIQQYFSERLFFNVIREFIIVFIFTFILTFLTTRWG